MIIKLNKYLSISLSHFLFYFIREDLIISTPSIIQTPVELTFSSPFYHNNHERIGWDNLNVEKYQFREYKVDDFSGEIERW